MTKIISSVFDRQLNSSLLINQVVRSICIVIVANLEYR